MAHLLPTVFPIQRFYGFDPLPGLVGPQHAVYDYDWPAMPWAAGAGTQFGRNLARWFRRLPPGPYRLLLRVVWGDDTAPDGDLPVAEIVSPWCPHLDNYIA